MRHFYPAEQLNTLGTGQASENATYLASRQRSGKSWFCRRARCETTKSECAQHRDTGTNPYCRDCTLPLLPGWGGNHAS